MHIFDADLVDTGNGPLRYVPTESAFLEEFNRIASPRGIKGCLIVQPSFMKTDNRFISRHLIPQKGSLKTFGVAMMNPGISPEDFAALHESGYVGIRLNLVQQTDDDLLFPEKRYGPLWEKLKRFGMHVEIHVEGNRLMKVLERISPHVDKVVVDHFMKPQEGTTGFITTTPTVYRDLEQYGELEKIWVKTSGAYRVFPEKPHAEAVQNCSDLAQMLAGIVKENRMLWGSDWPYTQNAGRLEGVTAAEKYAHIAATRQTWSRGGELFDPDAAFTELTGLKF